MDKLVWITGVSHCGGNEYLRHKFLPLCEKRNKKVKIIYPGKMIFDAPGIRLDPDNVLNAPDDHLKTKMEWVFERIAEELEKGANDWDAVVIRIHRMFKWNNVYRLAHVYENVARFNPDLMLTFVDGVAPILERMKDSSRFACQDVPGLFCSAGEKHYWLLSGDCSAHERRQNS